MLCDDAAGTDFPALAASVGFDLWADSNAPDILFPVLKRSGIRLAVYKERPHSDLPGDFRTEPNGAGHPDLFVALMFDGNGVIMECSDTQPLAPVIRGD